MKGPAPSRPKKPPSPQKLTLLCIFRGAFVRRSPSGELSYVDGENRLISVDRRGGVAMSKLAARIADLCPGCSFSLKYQLPEASIAPPKLIPIATDEDVRRMVEEHDRIVAEKGRAPRLRIYLCDVRPLPVRHVEVRYFSSGNGIGSCSRLGGSNGEKLVLDRGSALGDLNEKFHARKYGNFRENLGNRVLGNQLGNYETCGPAHLPRFNYLVGSTTSHLTQVPCHGFSPSISHKAEIFPIKTQVINAAEINCENAIDHSPIQTCLAPPTISSQSSHKRNPQWKVSGGSRGLLGVPHSTTRNSRLGVGGNIMRHNQTVYCDVQGQKIGSDGFVVQRFNDDKVRELKYHLGTRRRSGNSKLAHSRAHLHQLVKPPNGTSHITPKDEILQPTKELDKTPNEPQSLPVVGFGMQRMQGVSCNQSCSQMPLDVKSQPLPSGTMSFMNYPLGDANPVGHSHAVYHRSSIIRTGQEQGTCKLKKSCLVENVPGNLQSISFSSLSMLPGENIEKVEMNLGLTTDIPKADLSHKLDSTADPMEKISLNSSCITFCEINTSINIYDKKAEESTLSQPLSSLLEHVSLRSKKETHTEKDHGVDDKANAASSKDICSKEVGEATCKLSAIYSLLSAQELQVISNSDLEEIRELGSGNFGTVFYGKWRGSDVAIKRLKPICLSGGESGEEKMVMDFWKEARLLGQLHHPNVVAFYGVVAEEPERNLALVTEYMVNGSLKQVLKRKDRTIDRRKRVLIAMDAAFGMEYLHEKNIVHFDLKSHNFFMNMRDPHRPVCKIGDLGLSKVKQRTLVSGGIRGTIPWMAPELFSCTKNMVTEKVDVYSFGIVMWELLTGEEPYENLRSDEIIAGIIKGDLRPKVPSWCDPAWKSLMERCWSSDPEARPSFSEIAKELRDVAESMNIKY
uniref:Protein kinase domain-containing protein n=1 Tax=Ananas comosus var. bracteatus TaxID=296719 RepID=A0A6V7PTI5_ANACO|nr:unnamed protein product [Ananas comosus var. bracteatus]